jgi:glycosyltransferase involved in cell wall biosynthesis
MGESSFTYPMVTVVSVSYNVCEEAAATIESVLNQNYPNIEYIIVDNVSTDGTLDIINRYSSKINHLIVEKDAGTYDAMNKAVKLAKGEWIWFMNMGDRLPANLNLMREIFSNQFPSEVKVIYGNTFVEADDLKYHKKFNAQIAKNIKFGIVHLNHQSMICRASCFDTIGCFETHDLKIKSDAFWLSKLFYTFGSSSFYYVNKILAHYNETGLSSNPANFKKMHAEDVFILKSMDKRWQLFLLQVNWLFKLIRIQLFFVLKKQSSLFSLYRKLKYNTPNGRN